MCRIISRTLEIKTINKTVAFVWQINMDYIGESMFTQISNDDDDDDDDDQWRYSSDRALASLYGFHDSL
jgi:hypothetical protein